MPIYILILGASEGFSEKYLNLAQKEISMHKNLTLIDKSKIYKNIGQYTKRNIMFFNCAILIKTILPPNSLLQELNYIELKLGRIRSYKNSPRSIDIDIFLANFFLNNKKLSIPHRDGFNREFFLKPALEIVDRLPLGFWQNHGQNPPILPKSITMPYLGR